MTAGVWLAFLAVLHRLIRHDWQETALLVVWLAMAGSVGYAAVRLLLSLINPVV